MWFGRLRESNHETLQPETLLTNLVSVSFSGLIDITQVAKRHTSGVRSQALTCSPCWHDRPCITSRWSRTLWSLQLQRTHVVHPYVMHEFDRSFRHKKRRPFGLLEFVSGMVGGLAFESSLSRSQTCDWNSVGRTTHVVQSCSNAELH